MPDSRVPLLLLLLGFVLAFLLTRLYTRVARVRGWGSGSVGGVHLHHIVVGILLVLLSGLFAFALAPGGIPRDVLALAFGIGAALVLDEFALSFYLRDVYWAREGHSSIDAALGGLALTALLLVGACRLAKPHSLWARRFYGGSKADRAVARYTTGLTARAHERIDDLVGGMLSV